MEQQTKKENEMANQMDNSKKPFSVKNIFFLGLGAVLLLALTILIGFTISSILSLKDNTLTRTFAGIFNIPVASINGNFVSYNDYMEDSKTLKTFYSKNAQQYPDVTEQDISDQVLSRLLANNLIRDLAKEWKITADESEVAKVKDGLVAQFSSEEAASKDLKDNYGWDLDVYVKKIIYPIVLEDKVAEYFANSTDEKWAKYNEEEIKARHILFAVNDLAQKEKIRGEALKVLKRLKDGEDFAKLAEEFGSDSTAQSGGDLGWFARGLMVPEFEEPVFKLDAGELSSELIESRYGFHIVRVDEKRTRRNFSAFLAEELKNAKFKFFFNLHNPFEQLEIKNDTNATST